MMNITNLDLNNIFTGTEFDLPIDREKKDYLESLTTLYHNYINNLKGKIENKDVREIKNLTESLLSAVEAYLNGFPADAYIYMEDAMNKLNMHPLIIHNKSSDEPYLSLDDYSLRLFRIRAANCKKSFSRKELFHIPYNLRSIVSPSRYSIAGYPCLYLGTSLKLCCEEINVDPQSIPIVVSAFIFERKMKQIRMNINVIELGIKPQHFKQHGTVHYETPEHSIPYYLLDNSMTKLSYLFWYPLIAACSFIRVNKKDHFFVEYIVPQLLMQWVRSKMVQDKELYGIRYFSCANKDASDMGYTYVFPTSGEQESDRYPYCPVLSKAFRSTMPVYVNDYMDISDCEKSLRSMDIDLCYESPRK